MTIRYIAVKYGDIILEGDEYYHRLLAEWIVIPKILCDASNDTFWNIRRPVLPSIGIFYDTDNKAS